MENQQIANLNSSRPAILVADTAFVESATIEKFNLLSVFPREEGDGAYRASSEDLLRRSKLESAYYDTLVAKLIPIFETYLPAAGGEIKHFVRPVLVAVTLLFVDRCIGVLHRTRQCQGKNIAVAAVDSIGDIQWLSEIRDAVSNNWHLNQEIIQRIMLALGFEKAFVFDRANYPEFPEERKMQNLLFAPQKTGLSGIKSKFTRRYYALLRRIPSIRARIVSTGLAYDEFYATKRGLYGPFGLLRRCDPNSFGFEPGHKSEKLRADLHLAIEPIMRPLIESLLAQLVPRIQPQELTDIGKAYVRLFADWFPTGFLEGFSSNLEKTSTYLNKTNSTAVIGAELTTGAGYFMCASARLAGKTVIGVQHGGHYGYLEDMTALGQFAYALPDKMITWGWTHIDAHFHQCETIPLPCPKCSEMPLKADYLKPAGNQRDILFLTNLFHRFPRVTTSGGTRADFIDEIANSQEDLMRAIKDAGLTVDHKPYSMRYVDLYPALHRRLEVAGGAAYRLLNTTHKGLSASLIKTCRIVLWDQIGTGTLECFTSEVPTIVYWKRIYSRESLWARELVADLERCGVIHTDPEKMAQEIKTYLADPEGWMSDRERKQAIRAFCQKFALTDARWYESWKRQLLDWSRANS